MLLLPICTPYQVLRDATDFTPLSLDFGSMNAPFVFELYTSA
jgi:hypothetical protein